MTNDEWLVFWMEKSSTGVGNGRKPLSSWEIRASKCRACAAVVFDRMGSSLKQQIILCPGGILFSKIRNLFRKFKAF